MLDNCNEMLTEMIRNYTEELSSSADRPIGLEAALIYSA